MPTALRRWAHHTRILVQHITTRVRAGLVAAMIAVAGLAWDHHSHIHEAATAAPPPAAAAPEPEAGDYGDQPHQEQLPAPTVAPQAATIDAAHAVAQRFAANFATPNNNRDDWLARIGADVSTQLLEQYQLTDIRNVNQANVIALSGPLDALPGAVAFRAAYSDGSQIQMYLELELDGWKIVNVVPVRTEDSAPAGDQPAMP